MNNSVFRKTVENIRKHIDIKLVTAAKRRNYLVSERNYHSAKFFTENWFAIEMRKTQVFMNKLGFINIRIK